MSSPAPLFPQRDFLMFLETLGKARVGGSPTTSKRALELVTVICLSGGSAPRDWLTENLYEVPPAPSSLPTLALRARKLGIKVEYESDLSRYFLKTQVECDVTLLLSYLQKQRVADALSLYKGPFLTSSQSPFATQIRIFLENKIVRSTIATENPSLMIQADKVIKHPELSEALIRFLPDSVEASLSRSWLSTIM